MLSSTNRSSRSKQDEYLVKEMVGRGSFGQVEKCQHKQTSRIYAVKTIQISKFYLDTIEDQANNMIKTKSEYVLQLIDHFYDDNIDSYVLVTPFFKMGSFETLMNKNWSFNQLILFFYQMAKGLFDLSRNDILHLDLKPQNILIRAPGQYVLCDLGCSRKLQGSMTGSKSYNVLKMSCNAKGGGTTDYASPDLLLQGQMTPFTDIWSLGVIIYKVIYKNHPLYKISPSQLNKNMNDYYQGKYQIKYPLQGKQEFTPILNIVQRMLVCSSNKQKRLTWGQIIQKILEVLKVPLNKAPYMITNFDSLLLFVDKASILTSSVIYYFKQLEPIIKNTNFDTKNVVQNICVYIMTLTQEIASYTKSKGYYENANFYLFATTKLNLSKKHSALSDCLQKQAQELSISHGIPAQIGSLNICRERVVNDLGKFQKFLRGLSKPDNILHKLYLGKLLKICEFISFHNQLKYQNRHTLTQFVRELVNS